MWSHIFRVLGSALLAWWASCQASWWASCPGNLLALHKNWLASGKPTGLLSCPEPHQKYNITQYEECGFSSLILRWKMIILPILATSHIHSSLEGWENIAKPTKFAKLFYQVHLGQYVDMRQLNMNHCCQRSQQDGDKFRWITAVMWVHKVHCNKLKQREPDGNKHQVTIVHNPILVKAQATEL